MIANDRKSPCRKGPQMSDLRDRVRVLETQVASLQMAAPRGLPQVPGPALMLAECRRATIEACAAWIEDRAHTGWRSVDVPAALRAQMAEMAADTSARRDSDG